VIECRYSEPDLCLAHVARDARVSVYHLSRVIKLVTGRGFVAHVHARRTARARKLLAFSKLSIKEIASVVGYRSVTQLDRHYRRAYGVTPSATRRSLFPS